MAQDLIRSTVTVEWKDSKGDQWEYTGKFISIQQAIERAGQWGFRPRPWWKFWQALPKISAGKAILVL
jgi:hypothetical protein